MKDKAAATYFKKTPKKHVLYTYSIQLRADRQKNMLINI